jgi:uroporphyrinogen III methyltransferase/synthase
MTTDRPLQGKTIAITRPSHQTAALVERLSALGATAIATPTIAIAPPDDPTPLANALARLHDYDWLIFTSANGVEAVSEWLPHPLTPSPAELGRGNRRDSDGETNAHDALGGEAPRVAAIGPATAAALREHGIQVDVIPEEYIAEGLLRAIGDVRGRRILLPRAALARDVLAETLRARGAMVDEIAAYRTIPGEGIPRLIDLLHVQALDAIAFTSSSTVRFLLAGLAEHGIAEHAALEWLAHPAIACIGPITAATAREAGLRVQIVAREYTVDGLVTALLDCFT